MKLQLAVHSVFGQLVNSLYQLSPDDYTRPCPALSGGTIGQHVRHIIELFQALENGYDAGLVNYEKRKRDHTIETDRETAFRLLRTIEETLPRPDRSLVLELEASYDGDSDAPLQLATNYFREIAYNLEHAIHHMALIRIGIEEIAGAIVLPENYGIAASTIQYRQQCAQ